MKASTGGVGQLIQRVLKHPAPLLGRGEIVIDDTGDRLGRVRHLAAPGKALAHLRGEGREVGIVARTRTRRFTAEALHALGYVRLKTDARLLAVIHHVHPGSRLPFDHMPHCALALPKQFRRIHGLAGFVADQQVGQHRVTRQAADMGCENSLLAVAHRPLPKRCRSSSTGELGPPRSPELRRHRLDRRPS
jgi:hypothetical protein